MTRAYLFCITTVMSAGLTLAQDQWWCGGDGLEETALSSERNTDIDDARTYDDFDVPIRATVHGAWGNFVITGFTPAQAYYEIRSGISQGNGGTVHASGVMDVGVWETGRVLHRMPEYLVRGGFSDPVTLEPGRYWITLAPIGFGSGRCFVSNTNGKDEANQRWRSDPTPPPMGTPRANANSYFDSDFFGYTFEDTKKLLGARGWDFAYGVGRNTGPPVVSLPETMEVTYGIYLKGTVEDLYDGFGTLVEIQQRAYPLASAPNAQLIVEATAPFDTIGYLVFQFKSCVTASPRGSVVQRIEFFDFHAQRWVSVDEGPADKYGCFTAWVSATVDTERFVEPVTRRICAALSWFDRGTASLNWNAQIDIATWRSEKR